MKPTGHRPAGDVRPRAARFGLGRAVAAAPAMLGSLLLVTLVTLVTLVSVTLGRWVGLLLPLAWAAGAAVLMTRVGEQITLRAACGFHVPSPAQAASLEPAWSAALGVTGTDPGDVELYVQTARAPNAYAAGGRSVAVTSRVVEDHATGRLREGQLVAVLVHELGHHATGATRPMLLLTWLAAPWCATSSVLAGLANILAGRDPRRGLGIVVLAGLAVGEFRALQQGQWLAGGVLVVVGLTAVLVPLANAAISRRSEYAADRFAADHGLAIELAAALRVLNDGKRAPRGWSRLLSTHPTSDQRIKALQTAPVGQGPDGGCFLMRPSTSQDPPDRWLRAGVSRRQLKQ
jgi:STE24 endopeptidase